MEIYPLNYRDLKNCEVSGNISGGNRNGTIILKSNLINHNLLTRVYYLAQKIP